MNFPFRAPFRLASLISWIEQNRPDAIGLNDKQYAWLAGDAFNGIHYIGGLHLGLVREVSGVPIHFLDAPKT